MERCEKCGSSDVVIRGLCYACRSDTIHTYKKAEKLKEISDLFVQLCANGETSMDLAWAQAEIILEYRDKKVRGC